MIEANLKTGNTWTVRELSAGEEGEGETPWSINVAVKPGGTKDDAIALAQEARNPPPPSPEEQAAWALQDARAAASTHLMDDLAAAARAMTGDVPEAEKLSWDQKEAAALAWANDTATDEQAALLQAEATATGEDVDMLAQVIAAKAVQFRAAVGVMAGIRRKYQAAIADAQSADDVPARGDWAAELAGIGA